MASSACPWASSFTTIPVVSLPVDSKLSSRGCHSYVFHKNFHQVLSFDNSFRVSSIPPGNRGARKSPHSARTAFAVSSTQSSTCVQAESNPKQLVDTLLSLVEGTDRGALFGDEERAEVGEVIVKLEQHCIPEPLQSPLIFGEWDVVFSSNQTASGGYYRSAIGRTLLKTKKMLQSITAPHFVENSVGFSLLGLLPGEVSLKGKLEALDGSWIEVTFDSPILKLGPFDFQYGKISSVKLAIIYVDERIRLGRGSGGSLLLFRRR